MSETFYLKRGDRKFGLEYKLSIYEAGSDVLDGASARFQMMNRNGETVVDQPATIYDSDGILRYAFASGETDAAGFYKAEFQVTFSDGLPSHFPNVGFITVRISDDVPDS